MTTTIIRRDDPRAERAVEITVVATMIAIVIATEIEIIVKILQTDANGATQSIGPHRRRRHPPSNSSSHSPCLRPSTCTAGSTATRRKPSWTRNCSTSKNCKPRFERTRKRQQHQITLAPMRARADGTSVHVEFVSHGACSDDLCVPHVQQQTSPEAR